MIVLIADDDRLVRYSLKSMLCDLDAEQLLIYEATNGKMLVEQCRRLQPDIAFVDISMPQLDGLSAIAQCKQSANDTQFVVLTGHSDFSYAKRGIELQISDYILKPIDAEQLTELMGRMKERLLHSRKSRNASYLSQVLLAFQLWDEIGFCPQPNPCAEQRGLYLGAAFSLDAASNSARYAAAYQRLTEELHHFGHACLGRKQSFALRESRGTNLQLILFCQPEERPELQSALAKLCRTLSDFECSATCLCAEGKDLWHIYKELKAVDDQSYLHFAVNPLYAPLLSELTLSTPAQDFLIATGGLVTAFGARDEARYIRALNLMRATPATALKEIHTAGYIQRLGLCLGSRLTWSDWPGLWRELARCKDHMFLTGREDRPDKITYATAYVEKHYMEDISIVQLSEQLDLTPNYFSKLFHDSTGETFSAYLTQVRMNHAKRILASKRDVMIKDVALMVGYFSVRHFSSVFKKHTGLYPSEFREGTLACF